MTFGNIPKRRSYFALIPTSSKRGAGPFNRQRMVGQRMADFLCDDGMISPPGCDLGRGQRSAFRQKTGAENGRLYRRTGELGSVQS
ncbi:hypothetical protein [Nitratireductor basaltis]|uniref:Uncharacterized protein n=1 Tax=Nitratireductor basaltis TaxID=472175 RepID=A0A084U7Z1_9HYPH|nr:hypothetical protein [Nitratireductor basaltis]KFB09077.1 hypothetical protein EL18_00091 [Nitratireductor basaltis]